MSVAALIPVYDRVIRTELFPDGPVRPACRGKRTAVDIQQNRIVTILSVNTDPLFGAVDIRIHGFADAAFGCSSVIQLSDQADSEEYDDQTKHDDPDTCEDFSYQFQSLFHSKHL